MSITRRTLLGTATAGVPFSQLASEESPRHAIEALPPVDAVNVDAYGAVGDCPALGSTASWHDDTHAIHAALLDCPDGGVVRFSPGKVYLVSAPVEVTGKSVALDLRGAMVRIADDTVWHVFTLGGTREKPVAFVHVVGGVLDGNIGFQRYYPNTDGKTIFTDQGRETSGTHKGRPFYSNSVVNGTEWNAGWIDGSYGDGINLNGNGNRGLIRIQYAGDARFDGTTIRDFVRNGLVTWNCRNSRFYDIEGFGQLPTNFHELNELFGQRHEAAYMKVNGSNPNELAIGTHGQQNVVVRGGFTTGGAMPLFCRTNQPKSEAPANRAVVDGFRAYGFSRDVWFEVVNEVRIANCHLLGLDAPQASARGRAGIFLSNNTRHWSIRDSIVRGHIDTRQRQNTSFGVLDGVELTATGLTDDWIVNCNVIRDCIIRSNGRGALCDVADNVIAQAEDTASLFVRRAMAHCQIGGDRYQAMQHYVEMEPGGDTAAVPGLGTAYTVDVSRRNIGVQGGRWFELHHSDYSVRGDKIIFDRKSSEGDEVRITVVPILRQESILDGSTADIALEAPGADFPQDVLAVEIMGESIPFAQAAKATDPSFSLSRRGDGRSVVHLKNISQGASSRVVVRYLPPRQPYAGLRLGNGRDGPAATCDAVTSVNTKSTMLNGQVTVSGDFRHILDKTAFVVTDGSDIRLHSLRLTQCSGGVLSSAKPRTSARRVEIENAAFEGWGLHATDAERAQGIFPSTPPRTPIASDVLKITGSAFIVPRGVSAASTGSLEAQSASVKTVGLNSFVGAPPGSGWE